MHLFIQFVSFVNSENKIFNLLNHRSLSILFSLKIKCESKTWCIVSHRITKVFLNNLKMCWKRKLAIGRHSGRVLSKWILIYFIFYYLRGLQCPVYKFSHQALHVHKWWQSLINLFQRTLRYLVLVFFLFCFVSSS